MISLANTLSPLSAAQEALVSENRTLAKQVAWLTSKNLPMELEDAISSAYVGLIQAARAFDPSKYETKQEVADKFRRFSWLRMRGAVIDACRKNSFVRRTDVARGERAVTVSFDECWADSFEPKVNLPAHQEDLDNVLDFRAAFETLKPRERYVLRALGEGNTGGEVGSVLGITESRVSQIASAARLKLKEKMAA